VTLQLLSQGPDRVKTEDGRLNATRETADGLRDEDLGPRDLHDVEDEGDAEGTRSFRGAGRR
jgi:hypothetical protein